MYLERLTRILEIVGLKGDANVADICADSDLPKPTVYRLVQDLVAVGLLEPLEKRRFALGSRLKRLTQFDQSDVALCDLIAPRLKRAATEHNVAFFLSRLHGAAVEIIHVETPQTGVSFLHPGLGKRPLHACSCSKAIAAFNPDLPLVQDIEGRLKAYTEFTLTEVKDLEAEFCTIRKRGYAECVEEIERGMCSVASPLGRFGFGSTLSIGATGSVRVFKPEFRETLGPAITSLAHQLCHDLGWAEAEADCKTG